MLLRHRKLLAATLILLILCSVFAVSALAAGETADEGNTAVCTYCGGDGCDECDGLGYVTSSSRLAFTFWALVPPILAIVLALITKEVYFSLFIGTVLAAFFYSNGHVIGALDTLTNDGIIAAISDNAGIFLFLVILGILVALINKSGGSAAFGRWAERNIKTRTGAMLATFVLGILIFVDDYFNCLTVGSVMQPITDRHGISRAKLAFLIDATAAPVCMIAPISSWAAAVSGVVDGDDGILLFCRAIPWNFYSLLTFVFIVALILMKFDYGPMKLHEMNAMLNGDLYTTGDRVDKGLETEEASPRGKVIDLVLPVVVLIAACFVGLIYVGGYWEAGGDCYHDFIRSFGNTDAFVALPWGSFIALVFTLVYFWCRRVITFNNSMKCVPQGFINMVPAITILTLATSLKNITSGLLGAKYFIGNLMSGAAPGLFALLPAVIFVVGCLLSFSTGTSWGTFGILIPIVSVMFTPDSTLFNIAISACLAGAVFGDHCSPISDTTIMASAGAMCNHVNHVSTQLPYACTVGVICFVNFLIGGFVQNIWICMPIAVVMTVAALFAIKAVTSKKAAA